MAISLLQKKNWKKHVDEKEIKKIENTLNRFPECRKILIVPNKKVLERTPDGIEVWDVKKILKELI